MDRLIYLDNAATSWPKPPEVAAEMTRFLEEVGANPGRSGHRLSVEAGRIVDAAREGVAAIAGLGDPLRVVFGPNATEGLNLALRGLLRPGDHAIASGIEHNSVMRPLRALEREGIDVTIVPCSPEGIIDPADVERAIAPRTAMITVTHASNVIGTIAPVAEIGAIARRHGALFLVDAAQTAGSVPLDMEGDAIDLLAFTGHKSLLGPMGTGGLIVGERVDPARLRPVKLGGTGSLSEREEQPGFLPDLGESGTANAVGLAGLAAGIRWITARGIGAIRRQEIEITQRLIDGLASIPGVRVFGPRDATRTAAIASFTIAGLTPSDVGARLDERYGILCRVGLHCAPAAHRTIGTFPMGTVRFAPGPFIADAAVDAAIAAVREIAAEAR
ncbi:MAG: aminotransferase class V-fold PLP-dependent enzyme [Planctomycetes bacterium]|nr:aminotransferase class V-fold PLP-dependent enzyme [Planctomycetota bacterium]